jgi:hypothetical protein
LISALAVCPSHLTDKLDSLAYLAGLIKFHKIKDLSLNVELINSQELMPDFLIILGAQNFQNDFFFFSFNL